MENCYRMWEKGKRETRGMRRTPRLRLDGRGRIVSRMSTTTSFSSTERTHWHLNSARTVDQLDPPRRLTLSNVWHPQPASSTGTKKFSNKKIEH